MKPKFATFLIWIMPVAFLTADQTIETVQQALKDQGFYYGEVTGEKNADTTAAIRRYQIRNGLQITGELNDETLRSIRATASAAASPPAVAGTPAPARPPASGPDTSDLRDDSSRQSNVPDAAPNQPLAPPPRDRQMTEPNTGQVVPSQGGLFAGTPYEAAPLEVQRRVIVDAQRVLARRGLFKSEIDGAYGPALEFSLRAYQSRLGLPTTGRLDLETLAALDLLPGSRLPAFTPRRPTGPPEPPVRGEWVRP